MPAGKSTLVNRLLGTKISGVSSKRNTTITPQLGCVTSGPAQVLLYDTPGLVEHSVQGSPLERLKSAWATAAMADQLLFIVDAERQFRLRDPDLLKLVQQLAAGPPASLLQGWQQPPAALFLNKQDKLEPHIRAVVLQQLGQQLAASRTLTLCFMARPGRWLMPPNQAHTASPGDLAVELVREKLYRRLNQELPYALTVQADSVRPLLGSKHGLDIRITVFVKNRLMRSIVVGKGGSIIQGYVARPTEAELTRTLGAPVRLTVSVKALTDG
ncbi:P-loop containing nucleoside triphosphate hydrolase protein [Scenedesmus sp. NREL 46B-D3]|nr:P-loop containing nucleoside triphosphate hydrolase protein [Scenedesmus sp. NREL 46B-D3]